MKKIFSPLLSPYTILFIVCFFSLFKNPGAPFSHGMPWIDSSVFIYTAKRMIAGQLVYKEVFDHKGLTLYLLNIAGLKIFNGKWLGIWVLQLLCYFVTTAFLYKTLRFFYNKKISILAITTVLLYHGIISFGGNLTETWALPFTSIALYIFAQYFVIQKKFSVVQLFLLSATFILTLFLRLNLISIWGAFGIVVIFDLMKSKRWKELFVYALYILIFCLLTAMPYFLYAYIKGIFGDFLYGYFTFNLMYLSKVVEKGSLFTMRNLPLIYFGIIILLSMIYSILHFDGIRYKEFVLATGISFFVIAVSCSMGMNFYPHYFIQFIPVLIFPLAACFSFFVENLPKRKWIFAVSFWLIINIYLIGINVKDIQRNYSKADKTFYAQLDAIVSQYTASDDKILEMGNNCNIYLFTNRESSSKYPYIYPIIEKDKRIEEYYLAEMEKSSRPQLIITDYLYELLSNNIKSRINEILQENYEKIDVNTKNGEIYYSIWKLKSN